MAWTTPMTAVANTGLTAAQWNASVRDNLLETAVAKATTSGNYTVSTGANAMAEREIGFDSVPASETTSSTSFVDLATVGCEVTVTCGARAIGMHSAYIENSGVASGLICLELSGDTTRAADDNLSLSITSAVAGAHMRASYVVVYEMTPGTNNVFTMKYRVNGNTGTFALRRLTILPF